MNEQRDREDPEATQAGGESAGFGLVEGDFPPEVQAELKRADEAYTRAVTLLLLARIAQGSLPPDTAIGLGSATVTVPSGATDCPPVAVAVPSFLFYVPPALLSMPDGPQQLEYPLIGPKALLVHALQQVGGLIAWEIDPDTLVSPRWWLDRLRARPPEEWREDYPLTPQGVQRKFRESGREPPTQRSIANYADKGLLPFRREEAWVGRGQGHRRYPSDTDDRIRAIVDLQHWSNFNLDEITEQLRPIDWYRSDDLPQER